MQNRISTKCSKEILEKNFRNHKKNQSLVYFMSDIAKIIACCRVAPDDESVAKAHAALSHHQLETLHSSARGARLTEHLIG